MNITHLLYVKKLNQKYIILYDHRTQFEVNNKKFIFIDILAP